MLLDYSFFSTFARSFFGPLAPSPHPTDLVFGLEAGATRGPKGPKGPKGHTKGQGRKHAHLHLRLRIDSQSTLNSCIIIALRFLPFFSLPRPSVVGLFLWHTPIVNIDIHFRLP